MNKIEFKNAYSEARAIMFRAMERARNLPCGADDAVYESASYAVEKLCKENSALEYVLEHRHDQDPLADPMRAIRRGR